MQPLKIHFLQHASFEGPGHFSVWASEHGHLQTCTRFFEQDLLPDIEEIDWLVIMGGPMSVHDEAQYPWLRQEKEFIQRAIATGKIVVGVCLGAQLIADVLGARVYPGLKEIGWYPVLFSNREQFSNEAVMDQLSGDMSSELTVFHWHGDTFDLPAGSIHLASSPGCRNQGFFFQGRVLAVQFHLEVTGTMVAEMVNAGRKELRTAGAELFIQAEAEILAGEKYLSAMHRCLEQMLARLERQAQLLRAFRHGKN